MPLMRNVEKRRMIEDMQRPMAIKKCPRAIHKNDPWLRIETTLLAFKGHGVP